MPVSAARAAAFDILIRVNELDSYASELLHSDRLNHLTAADRGLCTELVMGVLRWQSALDTAIEPFSSQKISRLDPEVLVALRLAVYQVHHLDRIPSRAAVNESVELVKRARKKSAVPFVNAVLRKFTAIPPDPFSESEPTIEQLPMRLAHPQWLVSRWALEYGLAATTRICQHDQQTPSTTLRLHEDAAAVEAELRAAGIDLEPGKFVRDARLVVSGDVVNTPAFRENRVAIQDEASQLVALLVGTGTRLLDCCAAPGGKTAALAERNPTATILAVELHPHRSRTMAERLAGRNVEVLTADATALPYGAEFDRVLADVPCSGTGTLARNPEIKWKLTAADLADLQARQIAILTAAMRHVAPGGRVVYSTCSLESEENEAVVEQALAAHTDFRVVNAAERLQELRDSGDLVWTTPETLVHDRFLRTLPGTHPCDGFFAAILERNP